MEREEDGLERLTRPPWAWRTPVAPPSNRRELLMSPLLERCPGVCLIEAENKCFVLHLFLEVVVVAEAGVKAEASRHSVLMCAHEVLEADVALGGLNMHV